MTEPTILHAVFTARPDKGDEVAALLRDFAAVVRAEEGNVVFDATRLVDDPDRFFVYEVYRDEAAFQAHISAPAGVPFNEALQQLIVEPASVLTFLRRI
ncbi:MAG: putative quinol monooxygenase [Microbacterium sp.]|uniref:putative quinol monooxygenase n=1 Tax=Microbacterium TaxID=33882 RepID=UPI0006F6C670|nr:MULTISPECIES: putative quinol monooxygenase [unclassified Microbacterium]KRD49772.1 antibiotic biosynthesis monooxygenase [Microbacterium sp. Root280D1]CAH0237196.1 (4S)-4-hydroxy-5-phosphonooxypentane-2,3-dione isomerase [Microbacterium sp. Bi98]